MNIVSIEYKEAHPDWAKHGCAQFYIQIEVDRFELPDDTSYRGDGVAVWEEKLLPLGVVPDSIQRLSGWNHEAFLYWHDRDAALKAFASLKNAANPADPVD